MSHDSSYPPTIPLNYMSRRTFLGGALAVGVAGCGNSPSSGTTTLQIWDISLEQKKFHEQAAAEFQRTHPSISIDWRSIEESQYDKTLPLAFQSQRAPDLFDFNYEPAPEQSMSYLIKQGWIRPLSPDGNDVPPDFRKRWPNPEQEFLDGVLVSKGVAYGFPFNDRVIYGPGYMFLHKKLFAQAGLDAQHAPRTWSELRDTCAKLKQKTGKFPIVCPMKSENLNRFFNGGIASGIYTDQFFDLKRGRFSMDDERMLTAFRFAQELYNAGYIAPGLYDKNFARAQFAAGEGAIYIDGSYMTAVWRSNGFDSSNYTVNPHPYPDDGMPQGRLGHNPGQGGLWVSAQTKNPEACWEFVQWMTDPNGWFAEHYVGEGLGFLKFTDNAKYVKDPGDRKVIEIATRDNFRVNLPKPLLKCPDVASSKAYLNATSQHPNWETEEQTKALLDNTDLTGVARKVASTRQGWLEQGLKDEAAKGLSVSMECYTFPDWEYTEHYDASRYPKR